MPFLYLPDAVSLALLLVALHLLRRLAVAHLRQEFTRLRIELLYHGSETVYRPACDCLRRQILSAIGFADLVSPSRLFWVARKMRGVDIGTCRHMLPAWAAGSEPQLRVIGDRKVREKLRRIQLESDISLGSFYLFGSISGWVLSIGILFFLIRRALPVRADDRIDWFFDLLERILVRLGRRARNLSLLASPGHGMQRLA